MTDRLWLSVVIPFYNGVEGVFKLVEQLQCDDDRYEVVVVNDGSIECSEDEIAARFEIFKNVRMVSYPDNRGVSAARNAGIQASRGDYIWMVDSDDFVACGDVLRLIGWLEDMGGGADVLLFSWTTEPGARDGRSLQPTEIDRDEAIQRIYERDGYVWDKVFSRKTIVDNGLSFDERLFWAEDKLFSVQYLLSAKRGIFQTLEKLYCHKRNQASFTGTKLVDKKHLTLVDSKCRLLDLAITAQVNGLVEIAEADLVADALMLLFRLVKQRPEGWRSYWSKYWGIVAPYGKRYLRSQALSKKHRLFLAVCPLIDFILHETREAVA